MSLRNRQQKLYINTNIDAHSFLVNIFIMNFCTIFIFPIFNFLELFILALSLYSSGGTSNVSVCFMCDMLHMLVNRLQ